ncbi:hypothetical protein P4475_14645 [Halalkalibacterium halodurans]|uniref:hypothetical protein n=1 Tax=Halalkalibacterium halodurans TaxID=86665 RepID=UPI002E1D98C4|nr:hypothetical protein [Halalkalibacterium halodurans]
MRKLKNNHIFNRSIVLCTALLVLSLLPLSARAMNHKELEQLISGCEKVGGEVETIVHNQMTNSYSFTCH